MNRAYAEEIRAVGHLRSDALVEALARVPRDAFLGPGPWQIAQPLDREHPYRGTPDADPSHVHHDVVVAIDPARQLNNGQPSLVSRMIEAVAPAPGESVMHLGCGTGYFTALMAEMVGERGRVVAIELDDELAARARASLAPWPWVEVHAGDGSDPRGPHHGILVNAGCTHARRAWVEALAPGGRIVLPLTARIPQLPHGVGWVVRAVRDGDDWPLTMVTPVSVFDCENARDPAEETALRAALAAATPPTSLVVR